MDGKPKVDMCSHCGKNPAGSGLCPFAEEINNEEVECDCCDACREQCALDI